MNTLDTNSKDVLRYKAIDAIVDFIGRNEDIQMYFDEELQDFGFEFDPDGALTSNDEAQWTSAIAIVQMKLLAKVMEVL